MPDVVANMKTDGHNRHLFDAVNVSQQFHGFFSLAGHAWCKVYFSAFYNVFVRSHALNLRQKEANSKKLLVFKWCFQSTRQSHALAHNSRMFFNQKGNALRSSLVDLEGLIFA